MRVMPPEGVTMSADRARSLSTPTLGLIWFGASISLAEILTGTFFAPLGFERGLAAILVGGGALFWLVSFVSAKTGTSAMEAVARSFGRAGAGAFSLANVVQLVGWTAIMIMSGGAAATLLVPQLGMMGWCAIIGALIVMWIAIGVKRMGRVQSAAAVLLFALTLVVSSVVFGSGGSTAAAGGGGLSFGAAVELACAMPLSWLPVAGDYLREAKRPAAGTAAASVAYTLGSCWMFVIGLGCALFAGSDDIAAVLGQAGFGIVGVIVVVFSTLAFRLNRSRSASTLAPAASSPPSPDAHWPCSLPWAISRSSSTSSGRYSRPWPQSCASTTSPFTAIARQPPSIGATWRYGPSASSCTDSH